MERIASRQHGNVTRKQLLTAGFADTWVDRRIADGYLLPQHPGVYRVGHRAPSTDADYMAAVLACGDDALLYGLAAAHLHALLRGRPPRPHVVAPTERKVEGVLTTRCRRGALQRTKVRNIPVITVPQTLIAVTPLLTVDALARACHEAGVRYGTGPKGIEPLLRPNAPGAGKLRAIIAGDVKVSLSALERRFLKLLRDHGLPLPQTNRPAGTKRVDCRWPEHRLTVELDSYRFHNSRYAWEQDRLREREARARGDKFRRYTWADVDEDPRHMIRELTVLLGR